MRRRDEPNILVLHTTQHRSSNVHTHPPTLIWHLPSPPLSYHRRHRDCPLHNNTLSAPPSLLPSLPPTPYPSQGAAPTPNPRRTQPPPSQMSTDGDGDAEPPAAAAPSLAARSSAACRLSDPGFVALLMREPDGDVLRAALAKALSLGQGPTRVHANRGVLRTWQRHLVLVRSLELPAPAAQAVLLLLQRTCDELCGGAGPFEAAEARAKKTLSSGLVALLRGQLCLSDSKAVVDHAAATLFACGRLARHCAQHDGLAAETAVSMALPQAAPPQPLALATRIDERQAADAAALEAAEEGARLVAEEGCGLEAAEAEARMAVALKGCGEVAELEEGLAAARDSLSEERCRHVMKSIAYTVKAEMQPAEGIMAQLNELEAQLQAVVARKK